MNLEDMNELFRDHPLFVPGSKWRPSSEVDERAQRIAKQEGEVEALNKDDGAEYLEGV